MEKEWMKLIDDVENDRSYSSEPHFKFIDFIREKSTIEDKRAIVQDVERRIKKVVNREENNPDYFFRNFSESERELLDDLLGLREVTLDEMMLHPTAAEVERLSKLNDKLYKLTLECFEQCRNLWLTLYHRHTRWTTVSGTTWTVRFDSSMLTKTRSCIWRMMTITVPTSTI